jgi:hypothetical protein
MRRLIVLIGLLALGLPAAAGAFLGSSGDGTLVVDNAKGVIVLNIRGGIIGRFDQGTIDITDPVEADGPPPVVRDYQSIRRLGPKRFLYSGENVRFRLIGGLSKVRIEATGIDVSAVGRGTATLDGSGFSDLQTGRYSLNGGPFLAMPRVPKLLTLGLQPQPPPSGQK